MTSMQAVVYDRYGPPDVLRLVEVDRPVPKDDEILVRVGATAVTRADCATREANRRSGPAVSLLSRSISGIRRPRQPILGSEFAGVIDSVGRAVTSHVAGDRVFGTTGFMFGAYAEYVCLAESARIAPISAELRFEEAAAIPDGGLNALWCLRLANVQEGQRVLVFGASGAIGTAGVQIARYLGADVTAVCSTRHVELAASLGANQVIDYTKEDFTTNGQTYDAIFDAVGKHSFIGCRRSLKPGGSYLATDGLRNLVWAVTDPARRAQEREVLDPAPLHAGRRPPAQELIETGRYRAVLDRTYPLASVVEATRYVETEHKTGNVVLLIGSDQD